MDITEVRKENDLIDLFCNLAEIHSPSLHEENVANYIKSLCDENEIDCKFDDYGNLYINIPPTAEGKEPLLLSSHMDVIGDDSPVKTYLDEEGLIHAEGRTLGADDKAGVANALYFATYLVKSDIKHGGLEIVFTRDEETNMSGINHVNFEDLESENVLVLDSDSLGNFEIAGAGYTKLDIEVKTFLGGHSGNDIQDKRRYNAAKLVADLVSELPNGVYKTEKGFTITSCNLGSIVAGATDIGIERLLEKSEIEKPYSKTLVHLSADNVINTSAYAHYSLRSSVRKYEDELIKKFQKQIDKFNKKYKNYASAELKTNIHMLPLHLILYHL